MRINWNIVLLSFYIIFLFFMVFALRDITGMNITDLEKPHIKGFVFVIVVAIILTAILSTLLTAKKILDAKNYIKNKKY